MSNEVKTLGEEVDELIMKIARVAKVSTQEAIEIMLSRARKFEHD